MKAVLLIDFGSTYTKVTAVDVDEGKLLGTSASYTTVATDINEGLHNALALLEKETGPLDFAETYACSSAAGGLRIVTSGLVPNLTAEAAKRASLGAGGKVLRVYSYQLTEDDAEEIRQINPEIMLLCGGTDGGNSECIINNAKIVAAIPENFPVVLAGNRAAARTCETILRESGKDVYVCPNVMPQFNQLNIDPVQKIIRDIFLKRIIQAKGLSQAQSLIDDIMMPTPAAVLKAAELLAKGTENTKGWGELMIVDVGGATTDVYTITDGHPSKPGAVLKGLPEPYAKRTVEGDIGMRYSAHGIVEDAGIARVCELSGLSEEKVEEILELISTHTDTLPNTDEVRRFDYALASLAIEIAVTRHAGTIEEVFTPMGLIYSQVGKDLTKLNCVIATGGSIIHTTNTKDIVSHAMFSPRTPNSLKPLNAEIYIDRSYILASMGLLSEHYPDVALNIMKKELIHGD